MSISPASWVRARVNASDSWRTSQFSGPAARRPKSFAICPAEDYDRAGIVTIPYNIHKHSLSKRAILPGEDQ